MSVVAAIGESIRQRIIQHTGNIFQQLGVTLTPDIIINEFAQITGNSFKSTFYVLGLDNVKRKQLQELVLKENNPFLLFKVKSKRPQKEVRFHIELKSQ